MHYFQRPIDELQNTTKSYQYLYLYSYLYLHLYLYLHFTHIHRVEDGQGEDGKSMLVQMFQTGANPILRFRRSPPVEICTIGSCANPLCWLRSPSGRLQFSSSLAARWNKFALKSRLCFIVVVYWQLGQFMESFKMTLGVNGGQLLPWFGFQADEEQLPVLGNQRGRKTSGSLTHLSLQLPTVAVWQCGRVFGRAQSPLSSITPNFRTTG